MPVRRHVPDARAGARAHHRRAAAPERARHLRRTACLAIFVPWPDAVRQFQLRQEADYSLTLLCVRGSDPNADAIMRRAADALRAKVRGEVPVRLEVVDAIRHDRGKQRFDRERGPPGDRAGGASAAS